MVTYGNIILKLFQYFYYSLRFPLLYLLRVSSSLIPKNKKLWIFGAREGNSFSGNSKYFFLYLKTHPGIQAIWISKNRSVVQNLEEQGLKGYHIYSICGMWFCLRACACFTTHGIYDINPYLTGGCIDVNLLHVTFPLKKMEYDYDDYVPSSFIKKLLLIIHNPFLYQKSNYIVSSSDWTASIFSSAYLVERKKVLITGCLRSDRFIEPLDEQDQLSLQKILPAMSYAHLLYFFPTWRKDTSFNLFSYGYNEGDILDFLEKTNSILLIGLHPFDLSRSKLRKLPSNKRIILINTQTIDPLPILKKSSVFITDYSSMFAGYLLLDRPIVFTNFNHDAYLAERELYWDYDEITPGPKADSWCLLLNHLEDILIKKIDDYRVRRQLLRDKIYQFQDGKSCFRLVEAVDQILNN